MGIFLLLLVLPPQFKFIVRGIRFVLMILGLSRDTFSNILITRLKGTPDCGTIRESPMVTTFHLRFSGKYFVVPILEETVLGSRRLKSSEVYYTGTIT